MKGDGLHPLDRGGLWDFPPWRHPHRELGHGVPLMFRQPWVACFEVEVQPHKRFGPGTAGGYQTHLWGVPVPGTFPHDAVTLQCFMLRCCVTFNHLFFGYPLVVLHVLSYKRRSPSQYPCMKSTCMCCCTPTPITCGISFAKSVGMTAIGSQMAARLFVDILNSLLPSGLPHC